MEHKEVIVRNMSADPTAGGPPDYLAAEVDAGDTLILLSRIPFHGSCVPVENAAVVVAGTSGAPALAEHLADTAIENTGAGYAAVVVISLLSRDPQNERTPPSKK